MIKIHGSSGIEFPNNYSIKSDNGDLTVMNDVNKLWGMNSTGYESKPHIPAFYVRQTEGYDAFTAASVMTWDVVVFNNGNHFANGTTFTAPIDGLYFFSSNILSNNATRVFHRLRVNGEGVLGTYTESYAGVSYQSVTFSVVYQLKAGDYADAYCHAHNAYGGAYANFNGCLIG